MILKLILALNPGFNQLFRLDRSDGRRAGGVALYTSCPIVAKRMLHLENLAFEVLWVEMTINRLITVCGVCYRPPNYNYYVNIQFLNYLQCCADNVNLTPGINILLIGDFNAHYDFHDESLSSNFGISLYRWLECNNLSQVINEPTCVTANGGTVLDLIITNTPGYFVVSGTVSSPSTCDHSVIYACMNISLVKPKCYRRTIWDMSNIDIHKMNDALAVLKRDNFLITDDINSVYDQWFQSFYQILESHVPHKSVVIRPRDKPWMNTSIRKSIRKRNRLLKVHLRSNTSYTWERYRKQRNQTTSLIRSCKIKYYENLNLKLQDTTLASKKWWGIIKSTHGSKIQPSVPTLIEGSYMITDAKENVCVFNEYFCAQCRLDSESVVLPPLPDITNTRFISNITTTVTEVNNLLKGIDISKACGVDGVGNHLLKLSADGISQSFASIINIFRKFFRKHGNLQMSYQFSKKLIVNIRKTTILFPFYLHSPKYLRIDFIISC